jgi:hypothetical protein
MNARIYEQAVAATAAKFDLTRNHVVSIGVMHAKDTDRIAKDNFGKDDLAGILVRVKVEQAHEFLFNEIRRLEFERMAKMQGDFP